MKIENTPTERIVSIVEAQREFFRSGATLSYDFRKKQLCRLQKALQKWAEPLCEALWKDLHKSMEEAVLTAERMGAKISIPNHYGMFASNTEDPEKFTSRVTGSVALQLGRIYDIEALLG